VPDTLLAPTAVEIKSYPELKRAIQHVLVDGRAELEALKVEMFWRAGSLIQSYLEVHPEEVGGEYNVFKRLEGDFDYERSLFYRLLQFANAFPQGVATSRLGWSHYRELLALSDASKRNELVREAVENQWPVRRLKREVRQLRKVKRKRMRVAGTLEEPVRGKQGVRQVKLLEDLEGTERKVIDLGFHNYRGLSAREANRLDSGDVATWDKQKETWTKDGEADDVYCYEGVVERVVDGDTLLVYVDLGFGLIRRQYLRFRGINTDELGTPRGKRARDFLLRQFKGSPSLQFKSRFTDKYDRYLSDIWKGKTYLNQALLTKDLADKY